MPPKRAAAPATAAVAKKGKSEEKSSEPHRWEGVHADLMAGNYIGSYGGCNTAWHALAAIRANTDLKKYHTKRSEDEFFLEGLDAHVKDPHTQRKWSSIATFDPMGLYGAPPTMAATEACMEVPEIMSSLIPDGKIVNKDGSVNIQKCAIDYVWNMPFLAEKIKLPEDTMREKLAEYTKAPEVLDKTKKTYLPPLGGSTVYIFGDVTKLGKEDTETAVRVHDSCCGSDVFGTDICTCRPYLVFAIQAAIECAQRGGVGLIIYFQKEGRGLGEVTKYRVYNARKNQKGGDCSENYFFQTENIAGIQDARFQEMMPDVLLWLGVTRIDWLLSMSSEKYDAITEAGIEVMQRVSLPDSFIPKNAHVEIDAKIAAGYHSNGPEDNSFVAQLRTLECVRERCGMIFELAKQDKAKHFKLDMKKMGAVVKKTLEVTKKNYPTMDVPYHSRWRHFHEGDLKEMTDAWKCDEVEKVRRLVDLATISVLLDAGAGDKWSYIDRRGDSQGRSEGLALASMDMFRDGLFSSDIAIPCRVNAHGLKQMTFAQFCKSFQVSEKNPLSGDRGRFDLLQRLADVMMANPEFFGREELVRPGNMVDYVLKHAGTDKKVSLKVLWKAVAEGLENIWPSSTSGVSCTNLNPPGFAGVKRGDVWVYSPLKHFGKVGSDMIPFHKLSQWLTYSLLEPFEQLGVKFDDLGLLTGLPEYRNGGLFVDMGVLTPRDPKVFVHEYDAGAEIIVEWRALTLCLLDIVGEECCKSLGKTKEEFPLARVLQGGTWAAGRQVALEMRPKTGGPPIKLRSTGAVF